MKREPTLGDAALVAARSDDAAPPAGATLVLFAQDGQARRPVAFGSRAVVRAQGETAWWFKPGPYAVEVVPFAAAPESGLRLDFVVDAPDPRLARQRFDLFLFSEVAGQADTLALDVLTARIEQALRAALEQGTLELPPCTSLAEWNAFRAGVNELLYTRFGLTVDDCVPVDLADVDYADVLRRRGTAAADIELVVASAPVPPALPAAPPDNAPADDAAALRRLFLELPEASRALRQLDTPAFATRQALLQRLALAALDVGTMPALEWSAPRIARPAEERRQLGAASAAAAHALDELWALLARLKQCGDGGEELDRIVANLEYHLAARRGTRP
ncbi:hypothetical protein IP92_04766 [Pseudoduganella flava]|uniref:Uncharacterized protein n=1 Tax=Pseudoduganella flava TaxID=871742 RepID=A0A562PHA1_9BURK|nr:hypothetical protein [Pseudoduganella flava]QGZ42562.1 hypothetical protein GO485_28360 [Pseudoduganella flava]TWI43713.1 hypothetical protein IP92_04766 [Pseudoduganella flava]